MLLVPSLCLLALWALRRTTNCSWTLAFSQAVPLALGSVSVLFFFIRALGGPGRAALPLAALGWALLAWRPLRSTRTGAGFGTRVAAPARRLFPTLETLRGALRARVPVLVAGAALALVVVVWLASAAQIVLARPFGIWDAVAIWTSRATLLVEASDPAAMLEAIYPHSHPDYPLLVPASVASVAVWGPDPFDVALAVSLAFLLALPTGLFAVVRRWQGLGGAFLLVLVLLSAPVVLVQGTGGTADVPLATILLLAVGGLATWLDGGTRAPWVAGALVGLLPWTKNEGLISATIAMALFAVGVALSARTAGRRPAWRDLGWLVLGCVPAVLATVGFRRVWAPMSETSRYLAGLGWTSITDFDRWTPILAGYRLVLDPARPWAWGPIWMALPVLAVLARGRRDSRPVGLFVAGVASSVLATYTAAYLGTPYAVDWQVRTSIDRLVLHVTPLLVLALGSFKAPMLGWTSDESAAAEGDRS